MKRQYLVYLLMMFVCTVVLYAGDLDPAGPPTAGTMKPLDQVEPRIPIPASATPTGTYTITQSGSYYLTGNRYCSEDGIQVDADDVTIDLMGYSLIGTDSGSYYGIDIYGQKNVEIRNGTLRDFGFHGIYDADSTNGGDHRILNVRALSNKRNGIYLVSRGNLIKDCTVSGNAEGAAGYSYGIYAGASSTVVNNTVRDNGRNATGRVYGIYSWHSTVIGNTSSENGYEAEDLVLGICAAGGTVRGNTATDNGQKATGSAVYGIYGGYGCSVVGNASYQNGADATGSVFGFYFASACLVDQNVAYDNNGTNMASPGTCTYGTNHAP